MPACSLPPGALRDR